MSCRNAEVKLITLKETTNLKMFICIAAYCNYKASNGMHIKILFLNNSLTVYSTPYIQNHPRLYSMGCMGSSLSIPFLLRKSKARAYTSLNAPPYPVSIPHDYSEKISLT